MSDISLSTSTDQWIQWNYWTHDFKKKRKKETLDGDFVVCESGEDGAHMSVKNAETSAVNKRTKRINRTWAFPSGFFSSCVLKLSKYDLAWEHKLFSAVG